MFIFRPKPKILRDLKLKQETNFVSLRSKIYLGDYRIIHPPRNEVSNGVHLLINSFSSGVRLISRNSPKGLFVVLSIVIFIFGSVSAPTMMIKAAVNSSQEEERSALEAQLKQLEAQMDQYEGTIKVYRKQGQTLKSEIGRLNNQVAKLNLQIQAVTLTLAKLDREILDTQQRIVVTEKNINENRNTLSLLLRRLNQNERASLMEIFLKNPQLSDFFGDLTDLALLQNQIRQGIIKISNLKNQLVEQKNDLAVSRIDAESVKNYRDQQKQVNENLKHEKKGLLEETRGQESRYQELLKQTKETAAKIRQRIFQLLGGGELTFEQAYEYAKLAERAAGIRPALLLAILDRESALGRNVGKCSYKTAMNPKEQDDFLAIANSLNLNPDSLTVSCPNADGVYGGAMGPAQFIPSTWMIYSDKISQITGHSPASPWNSADAFVATALYLKDALTGCRGIYSSDLSAERCAAAKYYAGRRWRNYLWTYGAAVISRAQRFQQDIETITG